MIRSIFRYFLRVLHSVFPKFIDSPAILMLHRVGNRESARISANQNMVITANELSSFILECKECGWSFLSMEDLVQSINNKSIIKKALVLTFDDGYLDNLREAAPVLVEHDVPFIVYISTDFIGTNHLPWWYKLEDILASSQVILLPSGEKIHLKTIADKQNAFMFIRDKIMGSKEAYNIYIEWINSSPDVPSLEPKNLFMNWDEIRELSLLPHAAIGCHTNTHSVMSYMPVEVLNSDILQSLSLLKSQLGIEVRHFAYPFGGHKEASKREYRLVADLGFDSAVTTNLAPLNTGQLDLHALPRCFFSPGFTLAKLQDQLFESALKNRLRKLFHHAR